MISNNLALSSQNLRKIANIKQKSYATKPNKLTTRVKLQARDQQSHTNLFNFINDSFVK